MVVDGEASRTAAVARCGVRTILATFQTRKESLNFLIAAITSPQNLSLSLGRQSIPLGKLRSASHNVNSLKYSAESLDTTDSRNTMSSCAQGNRGTKRRDQGIFPSHIPFRVCHP